jgi:rubrerythrin
VDVFDYAMKMEQDGESFYRMLEESVADKGLKSVFKTLADEEVKHFRVIQALKTNTHDLEDSHVIKSSNTLFEELKDNPPKEFFKEKAQEEAYIKARGLEEKSWKFYEDCLKKASSEKEAQIFSRLASEEYGHYKILDHMIELIQRPKTWLEDAEITHLEDY